MAQGIEGIAGFLPLFNNFSALPARSFLALSEAAPAPHGEKPRNITRSVESLELISVSARFSARSLSLAVRRHCSLISPPRSFIPVLALLLALLLTLVPTP